MHMVWLYEKISIHASAKEATMPQKQRQSKRRFQSTPPRRRRLQRVPPQQQRLNFNPRLREGGDRFFPCPCRCYQYFNPRLREGGDEEKIEQLTKYNISIHASAKEATATYCDTSAIMYISSLNNFFVRYF